MSASSRRGLSDRDLSALRLLSSFRLMSGDHLRRLLFTEGSTLTRSRRARSVLKRLTDSGYIGRLDRQIGGLHAGSQGFVYRLTTKGHSFLSHADGGLRRRASGEPGERFVAHVLAVSEQYVRLVEQAPSAGATIVAFDAEPHCWRSYPASHGGTNTIRPDGFCRTVTGDYEYAHFLELDLSTESLSTVSAKCRSYIEFWRSGVEQQRLGFFPQTLWIVPDERRRQGVEKALRRLPADTRALFAVATAETSTPLLLGTQQQVRDIKT
ncbi:MAG: replication-relaxation family protein [Rhodococcus qingshengii]